MRRIRQRHAQCLQAGVLDLILQHAPVLDHALPDGGVLQEYRLYPRIHPLDVERQRPVALQQAERQHAPVADAGLLGIELRHALAILHVNADALLWDDEQLALLLGCLADRHSRHLPALGFLKTGAGEVDLELRVALGLALEVQRHDRVAAVLDVRPVAQRVAGDRLDLESLRQHKAQLENAGPGDPYAEVHQQHAAVLSERQSLVARYANVRLNRRGGERQARGTARVPVRAAHGQPGELALHRLGHRRREILQVDRREAVHRGAVQLHLGAGGQAREAQLSRRAVHAEQAQCLFVRERTGRLLRTHPQIERRLLRCRELDLQRPGLRVEPPRVHELRRRIRHCDAVRHGNGELAQLPLGQAYLEVVHPRHDPGCRDEELLELRVEHRLLDALVACLGFPVDPHIRLGRQHQIDRVDPVFRKCVFQRHGIRRGHFQFLSSHFQRQPVHHRRLGGHGEAPHAVAVCHARLVLETDVVHARLVRNELLRCRLADRELCQLQFAVLEIDALQHRWRGEELNAAAGLGLPLERPGERHAAAGHLAALHHGEQPPAVRLGRLAKCRAGAQKQAKQDRRCSGGGRGGAFRWLGRGRWFRRLGRQLALGGHAWPSDVHQHEQDGQASEAMHAVGHHQSRPGDEQPADQQAALDHHVVVRLEAVHPDPDAHHCRDENGVGVESGVGLDILHRDRQRLVGLEHRRGENQPRLDVQRQAHGIDHRETQQHQRTQHQRPAKKLPQQILQIPSMASGPCATADEQSPDKRREAG